MIRISAVDAAGAVHGSVMRDLVADEPFDLPIERYGTVTGLRLGDWVVGASGEVGVRPNEVRFAWSQTFASGGLLTCEVMETVS